MGLNKPVDTTALFAGTAAGACHHASQVDNTKTNNAAYAHGHARRELRLDLTAGATDPPTFMARWFPTNVNRLAAQHLVVSNGAGALHRAWE